MVTLSCPHCGNRKDVIKFGTNRSGTHCRCHGCKKTFTLNPKSRALIAGKGAADLPGAAGERTSQRGIARTLQVGRQSIRAVRKKTPPV